MHFTETNNGKMETKTCWSKQYQNAQPWKLGMPFPITFVLLILYYWFLHEKHQPGKQAANNPSHQTFAPAQQPKMWLSAIIIIIRSIIIAKNLSD